MADSATAPVEGRALGEAPSSSIASAVQRIEASPRSSTLHRTLRRIERKLTND